MQVLRRHRQLHFITASTERLNTKIRFYWTPILMTLGYKVPLCLAQCLWYMIYPVTHDSLYSIYPSDHKPELPLVAHQFLKW